jgi:hypothetical protein
MENQNMLNKFLSIAIENLEKANTIIRNEEWEKHYNHKQSIELRKIIIRLSYFKKNEE